MTDAQLYNIFACTELEFQIERRKFKIEIAEGIPGTLQYQVRQARIIVQLMKQFDEFNCRQYEAHKLYRLTSLRQEALKIWEDKTFDALVLKHQPHWCHDFDAKNNKN